MADFGTGVVYEVTAAAPEPGTVALSSAALGLVLAGMRLRRLLGSRAPHFTSE
jgi:hypothetical protein